MQKRRDIILGSSLAALAAGSISQLRVIPASPWDRLGFYAVAAPDNRYCRVLNPEWLHGPSSKRAFQFFTGGLSWLRKPNPVALEYFRRHSDLLNVSALRTHTVRRRTTGALDWDAVSVTFETECTLIGQPARLSQHFEASCSLYDDSPASIDTDKRIVLFKRTKQPYARIISALPLQQILDLTGMQPRQPFLQGYAQIANLSFSRLDQEWPFRAEHYKIAGIAGGQADGCIIDEIGVYSSLPGYVPYNGEPHYAISVTHLVLPEDEDRMLVRRVFLDRVVEELETMGISGKIECREYSAVRRNVSQMPALDVPGAPCRLELLERLSDIGIHQIGSLGKAVKQGLDADLLEGLSMGAAFV